jgi:hypothetical protein
MLNPSTVKYFVVKMDAIISPFPWVEMKKIATPQ